MKKKMGDIARAHGISEKKVSIWRLQEQHRCARAKLIVGELTLEEFDLEDATLNARVQAEKEAVQIMQQEVSVAVAYSDVQLRKKAEEEVLAKHERDISETEAYLLSFCLS
ncbi:uncharacterized protein A4U43_C08F15020 [Asparagus officinalis]|nr:uncharacterized protein A4U43_C08F15020 [Asparagus officinalis]